MWTDPVAVVGLLAQWSDHMAPEQTTGSSDHLHATGGGRQQQHAVLEIYKFMLIDLQVMLISAESLRFAHDRLHVLLSLCFSAWLSHSFFTTVLLETTIVSVIKNKYSSLTDSNNYRPIAIATITSKLLESVILL